MVLLLEIDEQLEGPSGSLCGVNLAATYSIHEFRTLAIYPPLPTEHDAAYLIL